MTFLFEVISRDDYFYVNAEDLSSAIEIFKSHYDFGDSEYFRVYVRIV